MLLCHGNPTKTTYRSTLVNPFPTTTAARLVGIIQSWVSTNASFILEDLLVRVPPHISLQTSHYSSPTHLTTVSPHISLQYIPTHISLQFPTHLTTVPPHISLQFPHTSHYGSPTHLTIVPPHISLQYPHTSHYSSPHIPLQSPHTSHYSTHTLLVLCTIQCLQVRVSGDCPTSVSSLDEGECESGTRTDPELGERITQSLNLCAIRDLGREVCRLGGC